MGQWLSNIPQTPSPCNESHFRQVAERLDKLESSVESLISSQQMLNQTMLIIQQQQKQILTDINLNTRWPTNSETNSTETTIQSFHETKQTEDKAMIKTLLCDGHSCGYLEMLKHQMTTYDHRSECFDNCKTESMLNNFHHLIEKHNHIDELSDEFYRMFIELGGHCNIKKCSSFTRHNTYRRQRYSDEQCFAGIYEAKDPEHILYKQIYDKIHCFYLHCYDIGNKITPKEADAVINANKENHFDSGTGCWVNKGMVQIQKNLQSKHRMFGRHSKFQQINLFMNDEMRLEKSYSFGYKFNYDQGCDLVFLKKYDSLQDELLNNNMAQLCKAQFDNEVRKAKMHHRSHYCRQYEKMLEKQLKKMNPKFGINHILSLMIYCNFDYLQSKFSETYRNTTNDSLKVITDQRFISILKKHSNFYFIGKYLKEAVNLFGVDSQQSQIESFYHGVNTELLFSKGTRINIFCPLSTSSSRAVAVNFATPKGIILELRASAKAVGGPYNFVKCFSVSWISDYGNEQEHFFIQGDNDGFTLQNITIVSNGIEFKSILRCIHILQYSSATRQILSDEEKILYRKIIENELHDSFPNTFPAFKSLNKYAKDMFHNFCTRNELLYLENTRLLTTLSFLSDIFLLQDQDWDWVNLEIVFALCPNLICFGYGPAGIISCKTLDDIYEFLKGGPPNHRLSKIQYQVYGKNYSCITESEVNYQKKFKSISCVFTIRHLEDISVLQIEVLDKHYGGTLTLFG
eukprot:187814_1